MKVFVNPDTFECHTTKKDDTFLEYEISKFDDKCQTFIEGHRCVLPNHTWTRSDGTIFQGEMVTPFKIYELLEAAQAQYEADLAAAAAAYQEGVNAAYDQ